MPFMFRIHRAAAAVSSMACAAALVGFAASFIAAQTAAAAEATPSEVSIEQRIQALVPSLEDYVSANMKSFDVPGLAIGIIAGDKLVYAKGFGVRSKGGAPVDTQTVFQIGSVTKGFLSTTMAIAVDQGKLHWDDRIVDLDPDFQLRDPWVTREFRLFDLTAQRSGLPPYVNDFLTVLGFDRSAKVRSLRYVDPVSSFRSAFAYLNIPHILAGRIVARAEGAADWNAAPRRLNSPQPAPRYASTHGTAPSTQRRWSRRGSLRHWSPIWVRRRSPSPSSRVTKTASSPPFGSPSRTGRPTISSASRERREQNDFWRRRRSRKA